MLRSQVIQPILDLYDNCRYLEIGVNAGETFNALKCAHKTAVEPKFLFDYKALATDRVRFFEKFSDEFFRDDVAANETYDVVFLDGLHQFEQTTRDLLNTLSHVDENSIIIVDDVIPSDYPASLFDPSDMIEMRRRANDPGGNWMGDVFKLVFFIRSFLPQWSYSTVAENHGQLVMWREPRNAPSMRVRDVVALEYRDIALDTSAFNITPFDEVLRRISEARARR